MAAVLTALIAFMGMALFAGPASSATIAAPCALPRTDAHHSLGVDSWDSTYPRPVHPLDAALIFLRFPDSSPMVTPTELAADHFPSTSDFYRRASYGKFSLRPHPIKRWIRMPSGSRTYGIRRDWDTGERTTYLHDAVAAADPYVDFSRYQIVYLIADPDAPGVDSDATKVVNFDNPIKADGTEIRRLVTVFEQSPPDRHVLAHETGHVFDLPDLYQRPRKGSSDWDTFVGDWDLMGSQFGMAPDLFAWEKWKLGWLTRDNVSCVPSAPGVTTHSVRPLDDDHLGGRGRNDRRLAVVRTGLHEALAIEARGSEGNDRGLCAQGVLLYWVYSDRASTHGPIKVVDGHPGTHACSNGSVYPSLADAPLGVGESYATDRGGGVRVDVTGHGANGSWQVRVTRKAPR